MPRKQKKYHYVYKTTCQVNDKYYIGIHSTDNLEDGYLGSGKRLWYSRKKHGDHNHKKEILEYCNNRKELKKREEEIVNSEMIDDQLCMNLVVGGGGFMLDEHHYKCASKGGKATAARLKIDSEFLEERRKHGSNIFKKLHAEGVIGPIDWTGKKHREESKRKISESMKGKGVGINGSQYGTCWIMKDGENKKIKKELLQDYIDMGWQKGRKINTK